MNSEPSSSSDLTAIDLSLSFAPAWAKEADSVQRFSRLAEKHGGGEDRPERGGKGRGGGNDRGPRQDRRPPRNEGGTKSGGGKRAGGRLERRPEREPRPAPQPTLSGWQIRFLPDRHGVDGLARQIKASAKAYPLFDLARLVLEKSERYLAEFRREAENATPLFQLKADGTLWLAEGDALAHALKTQLEKFYRRERIAAEPPKGVYPFVAVCGMSGALLGPPNYHDYQTKIRQLHAERFANMPFEAFKNRIRMERGEETIARWRDEQSSRDVFYPLDPEAKSPAETPATETGAEEISAPPADPAEAAPVDGEPLPEETIPVETTAEPPGGPASDAIPAPAAEGEKLDSLAEVERHFREHHASRAVVKIRDRVMVPGSAALNDSAGAVLEVTRGLWEELDRFPLPLAHNLGQQLTGKGLQIFKNRENITFVGVARPRHLDVTATPISEGLSGILEYLASHAATPRAEQIKALVAARSTEAQPEAAVAKDLSWLLHEGHVIDYARRGLEVAARPKSAPTKPVRPAGPASRERPAAPTVLAKPEAEPASLESSPLPAEDENPGG